MIQTQGAQLSPKGTVTTAPSPSKSNTVASPPFAFGACVTLAHKASTSLREAITAQLGFP